MISSKFARNVGIVLIITHLFLVIYSLTRDHGGKFDKFLTFDCQNDRYDTYLQNISAYCRNNEGDIKCRMENQEIIKLLENQQEIPETHFESMCCHSHFCGFHERKTACDWKWQQSTEHEKEFCGGLRKYYERMDTLVNEQGEKVPNGWKSMARFVLKDRKMDLGVWMEWVRMLTFFTPEKKIQAIQNYYEADDKYVKMFILENELMRTPTNSVSEAVEKRTILDFLEQQWKK